MKKLLIMSAVFKTLGAMAIVAGIAWLLGVVGTSDVETMILHQEIHSGTWVTVNMILGLLTAALGWWVYEFGRCCKATAIARQRRHHLKMIRLKAQARESVMRIARLYE